jgi:hypothetical protein
MRNPDAMSLLPNQSPASATGYVGSSLADPLFIGCGVAVVIAAVVMFHMRR